MPNKNSSAIVINIANEYIAFGILVTGAIDMPDILSNGPVFSHSHSHEIVLSEFRITSPNQKLSQNASRSASISASNVSPGGFHPYSVPRRNSEISNMLLSNTSVITPTTAGAGGAGSRIGDGHYMASPSSPSNTQAATSFHVNKLKNNQSSSQKAPPLLNRSMATNQFTPATLSSLTKFGSEEKFPFMVNNEEFPALNDSSDATFPAQSEINNTNSLLNNSITLDDYEASLYGGLYLNRGFNLSSKGTFGDDESNLTVDFTRYYKFSNSEHPASTTTTLETAITNLTLNESNKAQSKCKDPGKLIKSLKKKKNVNGMSSLIKMFPLIDQVKMSYPHSKFSVGASVDLPFNLYHYIHRDSDSVSQCIAPLTESCPITALYRVTKHLDDYFVPLDYLTLAKFHEKSPFCCDKYSDEILLFLYYSHVRDGLQMLAAYHLHKRGWRFHLTKRQWITLTNDQCKSYTALVNSKTPSASSMNDTFWFFNVFKWCMEKVETTLDFKLFESADAYAQYLCEGSNPNRNCQATSSRKYSTTSTTTNEHSNQRSGDQLIQYVN